MAENRHINKVIKSRAVTEGAGVHLHRAIGFGLPEIYDPFLLLVDFRSDRPDHYLRGFGILTEVLRQLPMSFLG